MTIELTRMMSGYTEGSVLSKLNEIEQAIKVVKLREEVSWPEYHLLVDQAYKMMQLSFIKEEMPDFCTRITWKLGEPPQVFEGPILRKINDTALDELLRLAQRFMELQSPQIVDQTLPPQCWLTPPPNTRSNNQFQEDFYHQIKPIFEKIWPKVMGTATCEHIQKGCPDSEKQVFLDNFRHEVNSCTYFKYEERALLCSFIKKVYVLMYEDEKSISENACT